MAALVDMIIPSKNLFTDDLPSVKKAVDMVTIWGMLGHTARIDWQERFLGTCRLQLKGTLSVIAVDAKSLKDILPSKFDVDLDGKVLAGPIRAWFQVIPGEGNHINPEAQQQLFTRLREANIVLHVGTVDVGQMMVMPPGFVVAMAVVGDNPSSGLCKSFTDKGSATIDRLGALLPHSALSPIVDALTLARLGSMQAKSATGADSSASVASAAAKSAAK